MARVLDNWERLVRATLRREQLRTAAPTHERHPSGLAGAVPPSLGRASHIDAILQAADEIQDEDPNVARILCEQAYSMAQNLDPNSEGRGVLQFKTGLIAVIKQKLAKRDGAQIDRNRDVERLWEFYHQYKRRHRVDDIQREEQNWRESGVFSTNFGELVEMRKVFATLRALVEVMKELAKDAAPEVGRLIFEELRRIEKSDATLSGELTPYNIIPLEAPSLTNAIGAFPEVRGAVSAVRYIESFPRLPAAFEIPGHRDVDMFDLLEYAFGFQRDNIRNQRENVILLIANAQSHLGLPDERDPKIDEKAIYEVYLKVLDNYFKWCKYLRIRIAWNSSDAITRERKLILVSLYFLIWGEAANVRFLPECICYIFHFMAKELDSILDHGEAYIADSCKLENGSVNFLEKVIKPIYDIIVQEAERNNNGRAAHSKWRNYDDFNEYFWSPTCFELGWPMKEDSAFLRKPNKRKRTAKSSFVEHRTFFHLYRSFHRMWIFLAIMFQVLTIIAFNDKLNLNTFKILLSVGPTYAVMNFVESCLDVLLMFGAYTTARGMAISRLIIRFFWWSLSTAAVIYFYLRVLQDWNKQQTNSSSFRIYILMLGAYAGVRFVFGKSWFVMYELAFPVHSLINALCYQERYYVGRGLYEKPIDYARYVVYWLVIFASKFTFAYFLQASFFIKPLVEPTRIIVQIRFDEYSWHDFVSKHNYNALTVASLWAPVIAIYLMDIHIWYTLLSALVGGVMGARARLGEIRSIDMVHKRFESFPEAFVKNMASSRTRSHRRCRWRFQVKQDLFWVSSPFSWKGLDLKKCDFFSFSTAAAFAVANGDSKLSKIFFAPWPFWQHLWVGVVGCFMWAAH
uniref:1,3-beta-glucan synthase component FKS1-like domain-containing protein n=1 Tax=Chenopodium quinoa TaxID=63459 RepID=A0A803KQG1_CHEQI